MDSLDHAGVSALSGMVTGPRSRPEDSDERRPRGTHNIATAAATKLATPSHRAGTNRQGRELHLQVRPANHRLGRVHPVRCRRCALRR